MKPLLVVVSVKAEPATSIGDHTEEEFPGGLKPVGKTQGLIFGTRALHLDESALSVGILNALAFRIRDRGENPVRVGITTTRPIPRDIESVPRNPRPTMRVVLKISPPSRLVLDARHAAVGVVCNRIDPAADVVYPALGNSGGPQAASNPGRRENQRRTNPIDSGHRHQSMRIGVKMMNQSPLGLDALGVQLDPMGARNGLAARERREIVNRTAVIEEIFAVVGHVERPLPRATGGVVNRSHLEDTEQAVNGQIHASVEEVSPRQIDAPLGHIAHQERPVFVNSGFRHECTPRCTTRGRPQDKALDQDQPPHTPPGLTPIDW